MCERLDINGREWLVESSAADGRYPEIWDRKPLQRLKARTGAKVLRRQTNHASATAS